MIGQTVTLINRSKKVLTCTFDGQAFDLKPGKNYGFPKEAVRFAKAQNPLMGSEHPYNPTSFESLVGVEGTKDPITPLEQSDAVERIDRKLMRGPGRKAKVHEGEPVTPYEARATRGDGDDEPDNEASAARV